MVTQRALSRQYKSTQSLSANASMPLFSPMDMSSPKPASPVTPTPPIPKLTSFKEATRCLESSSMASKRLTSHEEERKKRQEETFDEYDIIDLTSFSGSSFLPHLTPFKTSTQSYECSATKRAKSCDSEEDRKKFVDELIEEYDIIDITPFTANSHYIPKLTSFKEATAQTLDGSLVVSRCSSGLDEKAKKIAEEYDIIDLVPPKEIVV